MTAKIAAHMMTAMIAAVLLVVTSTSASMIKGPPVATKNNLFVVRRLGDEVKLTCPIDGKPKPTVEWRKDGEKIEEYLWPRFKPNRRNLKIRDAALSDSGRYLCRGVNGFGSEEIQINLIVIDPAEYPDLADGELPELAPPVLTPDTVSAREDYEFRFGDSVALGCSATGKPAPAITWSKDGVEISTGHSSIKQTGQSRTELRLINLTADESGVYTCSASNLAGQVSKEYRLSVRTAVVESPVFYTTPTNQTVNTGGKATLDCRVHSTVPTTIKWLKKLDARMSGTELDPNKVINVGKESYSIITRQQTDTEPDTYRVGSSGVYMSRLEFDQVTSADGGMYICFVTNTLGGFNYKQAYLTVVAKESPLVLALSISLAALTLVILTSLVVCLFRNRNNKKSEAGGMTSCNDSGEVRSTLICPQQHQGGGQQLGGHSHHHHHNHHQQSMMQQQQQPASTTASSSSSSSHGLMAPPPPSLDSLYTNKKMGAGITGGAIMNNTAPLPPPPTPVQWLYGGGGATSTAPAMSVAGSSIYTDSSQFGIGGNTYEVPRYTSSGYGQSQTRSSPLGQPAYVYGGYRQ